jgi:hypothetical protein
MDIYYKIIIANLTIIARMEIIMIILKDVYYVIKIVKHAFQQHFVNHAKKILSINIYFTSIIPV